MCWLSHSEKGWLRHVKADCEFGSILRIDEKVIVICLRSGMFKGRSVKMDTVRLSDLASASIWTPARAATWNSKLGLILLVEKNLHSFQFTLLHSLLVHHQ